MRFFIPEENIDELKEKFAKLAKKAARIGLPTPVLTIGEFHEIVDVEEQFLDENGQPYFHTYTYKRRFDVDVTDVKLALPGGWKLLGTLSHESQEGNIVNVVPGETVPSTYFVKPAWCDHCQEYRYRKETFVVQNEAGDVKQVGRQCIAAYLGIDPTRLAQMLSFVRGIAELGGGAEDEGFFGRNGTPTLGVLSVLAVGVALYKRFGWVTKKQAQKSYPPRTPSSETVGALLSFNATVREKAIREINKTLREQDEQQRFEVIDEDREEAARIKNWATQWDGIDNEYRWNLKLLCAQESIKENRLAYVVSAVGAYFREQEIEARRVERQQQPQEFVGTIGKREVFTLKFINHRAIEGSYSTTYLLTFETPEGYTVKWFSSNGPSWVGLKAGETYKVKATVKKHDTYGGQKQTLITRGAVLDKVETAAPVAA